MQQHVCIIGGGIIGVACAYYLVEAGYKVTLIEKNKLGQECSWGNCGLISPGHILPLAQPGVIKRTLWNMIKKGKASPFLIKPQGSILFWRWLWQFARNTDLGKMQKFTEAQLPLLASSYKLYQELFKSSRLNYNWHPNGALYVYRSEQGLAQGMREHMFIKDHFGIEVKILDKQALKEYEPNLNDQVTGGFFYPGDAHVQPDLFLQAWVNYLRQKDVSIIEDCEALKLITEDQRATHIETNKGNIAADHFVFATGVFTPLLQEQLKAKLLIVPGKGYSISMPRTEMQVKTPLWFVEDGVVFTPMDQYDRIGSIMELVGYNKTLSKKRVQYLQQHANNYFKEDLAEPIIKEWCGLRPMTPDNLPYIGKCSHLENTFVAAGHNMLGISNAPATGKLISQLIAGISPHINPEPYRVDR